MTPEEAQQYIHSFYTKENRPGLHRIRAMMKALGDPQDQLRFIHVAGTNGKGSTCAMLSSILRKAGYRTGLYTSPHIFRFNERMQVNGEPIPDEELAALVEEIRPLADALPEKLHEFELVTALGLLWFARQKCDVVVLEVGLGGEFDATNIISAPECALIANIGLDHTAILGDTLEEVASAKAGIIKPGGDAVYYPGADAVENVFRRRASEVGARLSRADFDSIVLRSEDWDGQSFDAAGFGNLRLPLLGAHQRRNAALVLASVAVLRKKGYRIGDSDIYDGLSDVSWPGRMQIASRKPLVLVDGGHNPQCLRALQDGLKELLPGKRVIYVVGILRDKDSAQMAEILSPTAEAFVTVTPDSPRAIPAEELAELLSRGGRPTYACATIREGVEKALSLAGTEGAVCAVGSLYMTGDILSVFG